MGKNIKKLKMNGNKSRPKIIIDNKPDPWNKFLGIFVIVVISALTFSEFYGPGKGFFRKKFTKKKQQRNTITEERTKAEKFRQESPQKPVASSKKQPSTKIKVKAIIPEEALGQEIAAKGTQDEKGIAKQTLGKKAQNKKIEEPKKSVLTKTNTFQEDFAQASSEDLTYIATDLFPGTLLNVKGKELFLFQKLGEVGLSAPQYIAYPVNGRVKITRSPCQVKPKLSAPWFLVWFNGGRGWKNIKFVKHSFNYSKSFPDKVPGFDSPWLVVLQHQAEIELDKDGVSIISDKPIENVVMMPLFGSEKLPLRKTASWRSSLPGSVVKRIKKWVAISRKIPVYVKEDFKVDEIRDQVAIKNTFSYHEIKDDWGTKPLTIAPLSPVLSLSYKTGFPMKFNKSSIDEKMVTHWGPLLAVEKSDTYTYTINRMLKYVDETRVVSSLNTSNRDIQKAMQFNAIRLKWGISDRFGFNPIRDTYAVDWGMGCLAAMRRGAEYLNEADKDIVTKQKVIDWINRNGYLDYYLNPNSYKTETTKVNSTLSETALVARSGHQTHGEDLVKQTSRLPWVIWRYGYYSQEWDKISQSYDTIKKLYPLTKYMGWGCIAPVNTAEHAKISAKQGALGLARLGKQFGDQEGYCFGAYMYVKLLVNEWAWDVAALPYIKKHGPWFFPVQGDMVMQQNLAMAGLMALPAKNDRTYGEIPLFLDRFNLSEKPIRKFNDFFVGLRYKYGPRKSTSTESLMSPYSVDYGLAKNLKALLKQPFSVFLDSKFFDAKGRHSANEENYYNYFPDHIERFSKGKYERLYPKNSAKAKWQRGLDSKVGAWHYRGMSYVMKKNWSKRPAWGSKWPYPTWRQMRPPANNDMSFQNGELPFGKIMVSKDKLIGNANHASSNWNTVVTALTLEKD